MTLLLNFFNHFRNSMLMSYYLKIHAKSRHISQPRKTPFFTCKTNGLKNRRKKVLEKVKKHKGLMLHKETCMSHRCACSCNQEKEQYPQTGKGYYRGIIKH